jgi:hypothetical protein
MAGLVEQTWTSLTLGTVSQIRRATFLQHNIYLCTYDLYSPVHNVLDACISITRARERGLGPGIESFLGPVKPPLTCPSNGYARIQNIMHRNV